MKIRTRIHAVSQLLMLLVLTGILMPARLMAAPKTSAPDSVFYGQYSYIIILNDGEQPREISDEEFFDRAAKIIFPVRGTALPTSSALLRELEQTIIPHVNSDSLRLVRMVFRGAASPEGPISLNEQLGKQRVQALYDFVASRINGYAADAQAAGSSVLDGSAVKPFEVSISADIEDYRSLCIMMRRANDADYQVVKSLCDLYLPNQELAQLKEKLQQADQGRLWARLLRDYFPQLRAARFIIYLQRIPPVVPENLENLDSLETLGNLGNLENLENLEVPEVPEVPVLQESIARREFLSIKTNLLFYGAYIPGYDRWCPIPNVAIEYYPWHGHFTFGASFDCPWWQDYDSHKYFQIRNYQLETRYYLKPATVSDVSSVGKRKPAYSGFYLQGYAHLGLFGICFDADRGWVGEGIGAGLGLGYVMPISKNGHWRLEFGLQAGYFRCGYDPYQYENPVNPDYKDGLYYYKWTQSPELFKKRQYRWNWLGPTRVGITLTYDLLYRRIQKRGVSFKARESLTPHETYVPHQEERRTMP